MIVYLDTSSLVKLYDQEEGSELVRDLVGQAKVVATASVAYVEARAAFARKLRESEFTNVELKRVLDDFERDWERYLVVDVSRSIVRLAGDLAEKHSLRGFDAIHLASALVLRVKMTAQVNFSCADHRLRKAALDEELGQVL